jgi:hypothetical protein
LLKVIGLPLTPFTPLYCFSYAAEAAARYADITPADTLMPHFMRDATLRHAIFRHWLIRRSAERHIFHAFALLHGERYAFGCRHCHDDAC